MKKHCFTLFLLAFSFWANAQALSPAQQKLEHALQLLKDYKLDSAEAQFKQLLNAEVREQQPKVYIRAEINLGRIYGDKGSNVVALEHYQNALKTAEATNDKESVPHVLKNIGVLYVSWKKFDKAFEYYDQAEKIALENGNTELVADCQNNKGIIYEQQGKYPEALTVYKSALTLYTEKNIPGKISMALSNIAIVYKFQKNYAEAIRYNMQAIALSEKLNDKWNMAAIYNNVGNLYGEMGDYKKAIQFCERALTIAKEIDAREIIESTYDSMADAAAKAGDYKSAFAYHKLFSQALSEFINKENTRQLTELNVKYESEKKQNLINQQQFEIQQKNNWLLFGAVLFLVSLLAAYFIYKSYKNKKEQELQLEIQQRQEMAAKALFEGEQNERFRIARDLHDSVGQMLSLVKINMSSLPQNEASKGIQQLVDKTIDEVRNVSHNLIPEELNFGIIPALENLADKVNASSATTMEVYIAEEVRALEFQQQNQLSIYRIVQEVLNNMIKHANASLINLSISKTDNRLTIQISDNGKGLDKEAVLQSKGLGWKNIYARVHLMDGKINIESEKLAGTQIEITLPQNG